MTSEQNTKKYLEAIEKDNHKGKNINAILHVNGDALQYSKEVDSKLGRGKTPEKLAGLVLAVKSNICVKGMIANCASKTLANFKAPFDATVISKIKKEGAIIIGMTNMDEFACGSSGESSAFGITKNPAALDRIPGGSSSGSAAAVAAGFCDVALGSDTGGSIRNPASHCGIIGFKPSYGAVSRYGLIDLAMSLDQIGIFAKKVEDVKKVFDVIRGVDERDSTTREINKKFKDTDKIVVGIPEGIKCDSKIADLINKKVIGVCKKNGWNEKKIEIKYIDLGIQTYYPICYVEFFSGTRKFDGRRFGMKIEDSCGEEVLRRILGGQMICQEEFSGRYYKKALDAKKLLVEEFEKAFKSCDIIIMPTVPRLPHKFGEKISLEDMYNYDTMTVLANLAEIPAISVPVGEIDKVPVGIQLMAARGEDLFLLDVAEQFESSK
ncbi:MAG: Asp-tRNA(Asn)/Glu-tRNA(Gln) amidotransferase subunit GatA [Nanoarchaeota archaeon]